jgi:D-threonate/D-erythronate kinase
MIADRMETRAGVCVVADDLTGAADTAVHFLRPGEEILLVSSAGDADLSDPPNAGVAIDIATRGSSPVETVLEVRRAAGLIRRLDPALVYKKLDSQLRGRPGLEIETLRRELGLRCALVAPAHPDQDRVTRGGVHFVRGVPVADAEPGLDPVAPATESRLPVLVAAQAGVEVGHVLLRDLEGGPDVLSARIRGLMDEGNRAITFDAVTRAHLELLAEVASTRFPEALLAGSAGLAMALAARRRTGPRAKAAMPRCESMLLVCGSTARALRRQVALLVASDRCRAETMSPSGVTSEPCRDARAQAAAEAWAGRDVVLQTPEDRLDPATCPSAMLLADLADLAMALVARRRPDGIFLSGGDTARAVLGAAGVAAVRLRGEALPGAPWGVAAGGTLDGVTVVTRAGAFGGDEDLVELHRRCREGARHD